MNAMMKPLSNSLPCAPPTPDDLQPPTLDALQSASATLTSNVLAHNGIKSLFEDPFSSSCPATLDLHIRSIQLAASAFHTYIHSQLALLKHHKNSLSAPISKLPFELLARILLWSLDPSSTTITELHRYARVSKYWLDVVRKDARFWRRVDFADPRNVKLFLRKSKDVPLRVECLVPDHRGGGGSSGFEFVSRTEDFMELVAAPEHAHRWHVVRFRGAATPRVLNLLAGSSTPNLASLHVHFRWHYQQTWLFTLPKHAVRSLRDVALVGASLHWYDDDEQNRMQDLQELELRDLQVNPPPCEYILQTLLLSPDLERLVLVDIADPPPTQSSLTIPDAEETVVCLPKLHTLRLSNVPPATVSTLLTRIDAPALTTLVADKVPASVLASPAFRALVHRGGGQGPITLRLEGRLDQVSLSRGGPADFSIKFDATTASSPLALLSALVGSLVVGDAPPVHLRICKTWWWGDDTDVLAIPAEDIIQPIHARLHVLELGKGVDARDVLAFLSDPARAPDLAEVSLKPWDAPAGGGECVRTFLERRYGHAGGGAGCRKLSRLDLPARMIDREVPKWLVDMSVDARERAKWRPASPPVYYCPI